MKSAFAVIGIWVAATVTSCNNRGTIDREPDLTFFSQSSHTDTPVIFVQPLGNVSQKNIQIVTDAVTNFYHYKCVVNNRASLTSDLLTKSKTRYNAPAILKKYAGSTNMLIITEKDIAHKNEKRNIDEWGIFGLGLRPGKTCVISTCRLSKNADNTLFRQRLSKICIHEIGHNLGLDHCNAKTDCLMNDAAGSIKTVDKEGMHFCEKCQTILAQK